MRDNFLEAAFDKVAQAPVVCEEWYVTLWRKSRFYGGPEEGGWWGTDRIPVKYKIYPSEELAEDAAGRITNLADELTRESEREDARYCASTMEWLEARGLEADYLPEPDGPDEYCVSVSQSPPVEKIASRQWD